MLALALTGLFLGVSVDERRAAEAKLRDKQAELDRSLRAAAASELASTLAHELNQPLSAIGTYTRSAQILLERGDPDGELPATMRKVVAEANRAGTVMRRLREFVLTGIGPPGAAASRPRCWRTPPPPRCRARSSITCC